MNAPLPTLPGALTLNQLEPDSQVQVVSVSGALPIRRRLLEMGLCPGVSVDVIRRAPLGDPLEVRVRGYLLSLRLDQAAQVSVVPLAGAPATVA
jgi:Fe2+ transport system protein FeoA